MLGNKDFAQMISSGAAMSGGGDGKVRFDLKQISKWDRENNKVTTKKKPEVPSAAKEKEKSDNAFGYRDRAMERRKDLNTEETSQYEELASKLDVEQTKFLGGDLKHTHLVKGLDYALLDKIRSETNKDAIRAKYGDATQTATTNSSAPLTGTTQQEAAMKHPSEIATSTPLGHSLKRLLFPKPDAAVTKSNAPALYESISTKPQQQQQQQSSVRKPTISTTAQVVARTLYQFSLSHSSSGGSGSGAVDSGRHEEIPVTLMKSLKEWDADEATTTYDLPSDLLARIAALYEGGAGKMISAQQFALKRKRKEKEAAAAAAVTQATAAAASSSSSSSSSKVVKGDFDSIYDDDVAIGRYVPVGAVEEGEVAEALLRHHEEQQAAAVVGSSEKVEDKEAKPAVGASLFADLASIYGGGGAGQHVGAFKTTGTTGGNVSGGWATAAAAVAVPPSSSSSAAAAGSTVKGIFDSVRTTSFVPAASAAAPSDNNSELMKPVRELLAAQANKDRAQAQRAAAAQTARQMVVGTNERGQELVHRDVFATTADQVVKAGRSTLANGEGDVFGLQGSYDLFPETAEYEVFSDDGGDEDDKPPAAKKANLGSGGATYDDTDGAGGGGGGRGMEGSIRKGVLKATSSTPWNRGHGDAAAGGGGGQSRPAKQAPSGLNRAARRAAAGGGDNK